MRWIEQDLRHLMALAAGGAVAFALFLLMHTLIATHQHGVSAAPPATPIGWVTVHHQTPVHRKEHHLTKPKLVKQPPATGGVPRSPHHPINRPSIHFNPWSTDWGHKGPVIITGPQSGQGQPGNKGMGIVSRIPPLYPPQAVYQNVTGTVTTCFTVRSDGSVANARVVSASSAQARRLLGQAALVSIMQWKFMPRAVNGHPVATHNVCQDINFNLNH